MTYGIELRTKVITAYEEGEESQEEIADLFQISKSAFKRWFRKKKNGEDLRPQPTRPGRPKAVDESGLKFIQKIVEKNPSITLGELSEAYYKKYHLSVGSSVLSRELQKLKLRYKKLSIKSIEKDSDDVQKKKKNT